MDKILDRLHKLALNGNQAADDLYWDVKDNNYDEDAFALWLSNNDKQLRDVLNLDALMVDATKDDKEFLKQYNDLRQKGLFMFTGDKRVGPTGQPLKTLDDFMTAFGVEQESDGYNDDVRAAFTNPENPQYWGNMSNEDKTLAALSLGYDSADDMKLDLDRAANQFQRVLAVEGWDANNEMEPLEFAKSTLKGIALPRVKEAQLAGREATLNDYSGDATELLLNFVPGVGFVKAGKVIAKVPKIGSKIVDNKKLNLIGRGAALIADQAAVPFGTQFLDSQLFYNPNRAGENTSVLNPRSEMDWKSIAAQSGAIAGAKGAVKGSAGVIKSMMEQGLGNEHGGGWFEKAAKSFEAIGEKTDDLIARRQLMLDRKAELAKKRANVTLPGDLDITAKLGDFNDLINAENFRILTSEGERIAKSQKQRKLKDVIRSGEDANIEMNMRERGYLQEISPDYDSQLKELIDAGKRAKELVKNKPELQYRKANEQSPYESLLQMSDGRVVPRDYVTLDGELRYPGADYSIRVNEKLSPIKFGYDDYHNSMNVFNPDNDPFRGMSNFAPNNAIDESKVVPRNPTVKEQILKDELLKRKMDPTKTVLKEVARDVAANAGFNVLAREGVVGNVIDLEKKREDAMWNRTMNKLRPLTANTDLTPEERKKNIDAVLNVMQYGLEGLPKDLYAKNPKIYHLIADNLGVKDWEGVGK